MSACKIYDRVINGARNNIKFKDIITLMCALELNNKKFTTRNESSHHTFTHPDLTELLTLNADKNGDAMNYQVDDVRKLIKKHNIPRP